MLPQNRLLVSSCLIALAASAAVKVPPGTGWANVSPKSVYSRGLGVPTSGMDTISVPYMSKTPFFPKFVDPKMMISKKTDMLSNMFGGLGPASYTPGFKQPFMPYGASGMSVYDPSLMGDSTKTNIGDGSGGYKRGMFGPFSPKKFGPKFGPIVPFGGADMTADYSMMKDSFSRKRRSTEDSSVVNLRSIMADAKPETKNYGPPPAYPTLAPISEEPEETNFFAAKASATMPKEYLPGMYGPFGPAIDPSMFISKKSAFLDALFKNLATSTTPSPLATAATELPVPKSTIVPPSFWFPTSIIPSPAEYSDKVSSFLDKLFESLKLNQTSPADETLMTKNDFARSLKKSSTEEERIERSVADLSSINMAKDTIVDSILSELGDLKSGMMKTMNDLIAYQKSAAVPPSIIGKKPFKPFAPGMWPKPTVDAMLPFQQRMAVLSQVFDMLTDLQKNITIAIENSINAKLSSTDSTNGNLASNLPLVSNDLSSAGYNLPINVSLLDAIKNKLSTFDAASSSPSGLYAGPKNARTLPMSPGSFWISYPESVGSTVKREIEQDSLPEEENISEDRHNPRQYTRAVKMQMHQGYQSLPAGSVESVQAGGGSVPGHQGGGIKLLIQMPSMQAPEFQNNYNSED